MLEKLKALLNKESSKKSETRTKISIGSSKKSSTDETKIDGVGADTEEMNVAEDLGKGEFKKDGTKPAKNKILTYIIIVLLVVYLLLEVLFPAKEDPVDGNIPKVMKKKKTENIDGDAAKEKTNVDTAEVGNTDAALKVPVDDIMKKVEMNNESDLSQEDEEFEDDIPIIPAPAETEQGQDIVNDTQMIKEDLDETMNDTDSMIDKDQIEKQETPIIKAAKPGQAEDIVDESVPDSLDSFEEADEDLTSKIEREEKKPMNEVVEKIEKRPPSPDYAAFGRGLVYNCKDKHWACVDKDNYFSCIQNKKWAVQESLPSRCVESAVYANNDDCQLAQLYNVNMLKGDDLCN